MNAIEIKNLHFSYGKENVLDGVSLCLKEGRLAILAGENGAGKSTLLRLLLGELPIGESHKGDQEEGSSDGSIEILGQDIRQFKDWSSISNVPHPWKKSCAQTYISRSDCSGLRGKKSGSR